MLGSGCLGLCMWRVRCVKFGDSCGDTLASGRSVLARWEYSGLRVVELFMKYCFCLCW